MRILIGGFGSRGDMQPMLAIGLGLRARGHEVTMCGPPDFAGWAAELALPFAAVGGSVEGLVRRGTNRAGNVRTVTVLREARAMGRAHFAAMEPLVARSDLVVASGITVAGASLAERCGVPYVFVGLCPQLIPSREHPHPMVPRQTLPGPVNRLTWRAGALANNLVFRGIVNRERARLGLAPIGDVWQHVIYHRLIIAADPALAPLPHDAPARVRQTAAVFMPEPEPLPDEVERFLDAGPPPIYIGFGSMADQDPKTTSRRILEAASRVGARVLLSRGWAGLGGVELPPTALVIGHAPHGRLFPRCAAVVHHGGAGTTANAARSGVPQVLIPHLLDQFYWCHRVRRLGLSPAPIPRAALDVEPLTTALRACFEDPALRERARAFAPTVARDGLERTIDLIEAA